MLGQALDFLQRAAQPLAPLGRQGGFLDEAFEFAAQHGQRRAQLVRGIGHEAPRVLEGLIQALDHVVERDGQALQFVARSAPPGRRSLRFCELIRSALAAILSTGESARFTSKEPPPTASAATTGSTDEEEHQPPAQMSLAHRPSAHPSRPDSARRRAFEPR